ncbi:MAG: flippase-like domain-containing protein [Brevibacillus sp.]|nr:flippase-like domain-containing protein [Brevibacillus sp.]
MKRMLLVAVGWALVVVMFSWTIAHLEVAPLLTSIGALASDWPLLILMTISYAFAFWLRSFGWALLMEHPDISVYRLWLYHHIGLFLNHVLPVKAGELARTALLHEREGMNWSTSLISVALSRFVDMAGLLTIALIGGAWLIPPQMYRLLVERAGLFLLLTLLGAPVIFLLCRKLVGRAGIHHVKPRRWWWAYLLVTIGWMMEAAVLLGVVHALGGQLDAAQALVVHALTIVGQTFHVTPGGVGTYEAVMSTLLAQTAAFPLGLALQVAILTHVFKFVYSFALGAWAAWSLSLSPFAVYRRARQQRKEEKG